MKRRAYTLLELIFIVVILGVLSAVAIPRLFFSRSDATMANAKTQLAAIRSGISLRYNDNILQAKPGFPAKLDDGDPNKLFSKVIDIAIKDSGNKNGWHRISDDKYTFKLDGKVANFKYDKNSGDFSCNDSNDICKSLQ
jgi:N-methylation